MVLVIEIIVGSFLLALSTMTGIYAYKIFKNTDGKKTDVFLIAMCGAGCLYFVILGLLLITGNLINAAQIINDILMMEV